MRQGKSSVLKKQSSVDGINAAWKSLLHLAKLKNFSKDSVIDLSSGLDFRDKPGFFYIKSGKTRLSYIDADGNERTILYAGPGTLMNVPSIMADDLADSFIRCLEDTEIAIFDASLLTDTNFVTEHPDLIINLLRSLCIHLVIHAQRLADSSRSDTLAQVCRWLLELSTTHAGSHNFAPNITQQELALLLGIHRTTLARTIVRLRKMKVLGKFTKNELEIIDLEKLAELAED